MTSLILSKIHLHMFKAHQELCMNLNEVTEIFGRNTSGKSSIAEAIAFSLTGSGFWGQKLVDPINGSQLAWVEVEGEADGKPIKFRRMIQEENGKISIKTPVKFSLDKDLFFSLINPRYLVGLSPVSAKDVILKSTRFTTDDIVAVCGSINPKFEEMFGPKTETIGERAKIAESFKKELSAQLKEIEAILLQTTGRLESLKDTQEFFKANNIAISDEVEESFSFFELAAIQKEVDLQKKKDKLTNQIKEIESYKALLLKVAVEDIGSYLENVSIKISSGEKDVFLVQYKGKEYKTLSNAEQLMAGMELVNAISHASGMQFPCIIDNAESICDIDISEYDKIPQFIILSVADVDFTQYNRGVLQNPITFKTMKRTRESLKPKVRLIGGWDK